jgi:23S rRNA pseudouridine2457 synthase
VTPTSISSRSRRTIKSTERSQSGRRPVHEAGRLLLFNKPYGVACQFSPCGEHRTLKDFIPIPDVYAAGRLDADSEGLLVLTGDGALQHALADPRSKTEKIYWAQVEGEPDASQLRALESGLDLGDFRCLPCRARLIPEPPSLWARVPPIRVRRAIPTAWIELRLREGKNRQVRRMTARVGLPTLRLIRYRVGPWTLEGLAPGEWRRAVVDRRQFAGRGNAAFEPQRPDSPR